MARDHEDHRSHNDHDAGAHAHGAGVPAGKLKLAVALTLAFVIGEAIAGWRAHSLALLSDAGHNLGDAAALGFSLYAIWIARKPSNPDMTFGYYRVSILAALVNAVSLVVIAIVIAWEAVGRIRHPQPVSSTTMIVVAVIAVAVNVVITFWLHGGKDDLNVRSAYVHMLGDAISAVGVVIAGIVVAVTHAHVADPIVSFIIAALILYSSWGVLRDSVNVLMEGTPDRIDTGRVIASIKSVPGVRGAHDLHVWTVGSGMIACSCHILVDDQSIRDAQQILQRVVHVLERQHKINHTTVQVEVDEHAANVV